MYSVILADHTLEALAFLFFIIQFIYCLSASWKQILINCSQLCFCLCNRVSSKIFEVKRKPATLFTVLVLLKVSRRETKRWFIKTWHVFPFWGSLCPWGLCDNPSVPSHHSAVGMVFESLCPCPCSSSSPALELQGSGRAGPAPALCAAVAHWLRGGSVCNTLITAALLVQSTKQRLKKIDFLSLTPPFFCFFLVFVQLAIPPHSTSQLPVRFCPSALGRRNHKATITLKCPKVW